MSQFNLIFITHSAVTNNTYLSSTGEIEVRQFECLRHLVGPILVRCQRFGSARSRTVARASRNTVFATSSECHICCVIIVIFML